MYMELHFQKQYEELQQQFNQWQSQLAENQQLLTRKKILPSSSRAEEDDGTKKEQEPFVKPRNFDRKGPIEVGSAARRFSEENILDAQRQAHELGNMYGLGSDQSSDLNTRNTERPFNHREVVSTVETYAVREEPKVESAPSSGVFVRPRNFDRKAPIEVGSAASQFSGNAPVIQNVPPPPPVNSNTRFPSDPAPARKPTAR